MIPGLMVQGTSSSVGKSVITAGLCRLFARRGYKVAPFKAQNMAIPAQLPDGKQIAASVIIQAEAAMTTPCTHMNPLLLEVVGPCCSNVYVHGELYDQLSGVEYQRRKNEFRPAVQQSWEQLSSTYDLVILEGAGSPAEINLKAGDLVNMAMANMADVPVLLVGDIDRGGVFAHLVGTLELLDKTDRQRVKGLIINKFRGDLSLLTPGLTMLEEKARCPVAGVIPYFKSGLPEEDSMERPVAPLTREQREERYDALAQLLEENLDQSLLSRILEGK